MEFKVPDMSRGHCKAAIENAVSAVDATATIVTNIDARTVSITSDLPAELIATTLEKAGYPATHL